MARQHPEVRLVPALVLDRLVQLALDLRQRGQVHLPLLGRQLRDDAVLDLFRQLGEDLLLEAAHEEGADLLGQQVAVRAVAVALHELRLVHEVAGQDEVEDGPELPGVVLHGRAGQGEAGLRLDALDRARAHGGRVLDLLRLVQYAEAEVHVFQPVDVPAHLRVGGDEHVHVLHVLGLAAAVVLPAGEDHGAHVRRELLDLRLPVVDQGRRRDDQARHAAHRLIPPLDEGEDLDRLAQAHVVGEHAAHPQARERLEPGKAALLVGRRPLIGALPLSGCCTARARSVTDLSCSMSRLEAAMSWER